MKRILVTRPRAQADSFVAGLKAAGFKPVYFPVIEIRSIGDNGELDHALENLTKYAWIVFTSVNGVDVFFRRLPSPPGKEVMSEKVKVAAIGPKTAEALRAHGVIPNYVPDEYVAESILLGLGDLQNKWVLLPRAEIAREALPEAISEVGGIAHEIAVYQTLPVQPDPEGLAALRSGVDWITFTSPSTVHNFVEIVRRQKLDPFKLTGDPKIACIGPITQRTAREAGFQVDLVAEKYTTEGLISALGAA